MFCLGYFSYFIFSHFSQYNCDLCRQTLRNGEHYIWDVRTGEIQPISEFVNKGSDVCWFSSVSQLPQEASVTRRLSYMRFPRQVLATARYCAGHTSNLDPEFLMLLPEQNATVCYAIRPGENLDPDGRTITRQMNEKLDCWELEIQWDP